MKKTSISLRCPKCYEDYEILEEIYDSFDQLKCNHCQYLNQKGSFETKKIEIDDQKKDKFESFESDISEKDNEDRINIKESSKENIPVEKITLNTSEGNHSGEIIKNLIFMISALALLSGFIFLMIRK